MRPEDGRAVKIGFIGLGRMGWPIARNLLRAGHEVTAYNRSVPPVEALAGLGARAAASGWEAAGEAEVLFTMLPDDPAVEEVIFGAENPGAIAALRTGATHVCLSTISVGLSRRLAAEHQASGQGYLAAPVFGRPDVAEAGQLVQVAAGEPARVEACRPLFAAISRQVFVVGTDPPAANVVKLAGNFLIASMVEALSEAFALTRKAGIPPEQFLEILNGTIFAAPMFARYAALIAHEQFDPPGFALRLGLKDMRLVLDAGESFSAPLPLGSLVHDRLLAALASGLGAIDWSGVSRISARDAGLGEAEKRRDA